MSESQQGKQPQGSQGNYSPEYLAKQFKPGKSPNPGGIDKATGLPGMTLRARLGQKLKADEARLERILEARLALCEPSADVEASVTLKAIDDLFDQVEGKLEKSVKQTGEPTIVVINGPKPVASLPGNS